MWFYQNFCVVHVRRINILSYEYLIYEKGYWLSNKTLKVIDIIIGNYAIVY